MLGDHPAHRHAHHIGSLDALGVEDRRHVGGDDLARVGHVRRVALAGPTRVGIDHPSCPGQMAADRQPSCCAHPQTRYHEDRWPVPSDRVVDSHVAAHGVGHVVASADC